jgi:hypothetical protein
MEYKEEQTKFQEKDKDYSIKDTDSFIIKAQNTCHNFKLYFNILPIEGIQEEYKPHYLFNSNQDEILQIQAELINKGETFYNENNEETDVSEKYYEIYTLAELKNNCKSFSWFLELKEFLEAFRKGLENNNYELLILKNVLFLNIKIINIFGICKNYYLGLRPCINKNFEKNNSSDLCIKKNIKNFGLYKRCINPDLALINPKKNEIKIKRVTTKKNSKVLANSFYGKSINKIDTSESEKKKENINNLNNMNDDFIDDLKQKRKITLPDFYIDGLINQSNIINSIEEELLIGDMITNIKTKEYRLLFRGSRDGDSAYKFHSVCDKYNNLIILVKTEKGLRFGGFTSAKFKVTSHLKIDNNAFLFSLDLKKVFKITPGEYAIYCYTNSGPSFSKRSLHIPNNFFHKCGKTGMVGGPFQFENDYELNNGEEKFLIKELEIFHVKIDDGI